MISVQDEEKLIMIITIQNIEKMAIFITRIVI